MYLLFSGNYYYPMGGWKDFKGAFDTPEEAVAIVDDNWWHVVNSKTLEIVATKTK